MRVKHLSLAAITLASCVLITSCGTSETSSAPDQQDSQTITPLDKGEPGTDAGLDIESTSPAEAQPASPPIDGGSCTDMERYFNENFGRSDTTFSNYEGKAITIILTDEIACTGGAVIQTLPTARKSCTAAIIYQPHDGSMRWQSENSESCFVTQ